jgi:DNA-binding beta-propeller fold protein YncE
MVNIGWSSAKRLLTGLLVSSTLLAVPASVGVTAAPAAAPAQDVLYVGNNWDGTADVIDVHTFRRLTRINIIPDKEQRMAEINRNPDKLGYFMAIRQLVGEGHDQYVDDMFSSHDGHLLYVSRPSFADVVAFDLKTKAIMWRVPVDGYRADHMAISPDGTRLLVSASTARVIDVIDLTAGRIIARIPSGDQPHENNYSADGKLIYHASIGAVYNPLRDPEFSAAKGDRWFQIIDATTYEVVRRLDMGEKLAEAGYPGMSSAVRPMALSPDERYVYFQVSYFHGFVEYDLLEDTVVRLANLPVSEKAARTPKEQYILNSAHHGIAMNPEGTQLCVAGTMSDYAAIVSRDTFESTVIPVGEKPYWATNSGDGRYCFVSVSGTNSVSAISYSTAQEVARIPVGYHPQRMRMGLIRTDAVP